MRTPVVKGRRRLAKRLGAPNFFGPFAAMFGAAKQTMSSELKFSSPGNTAGGNFATPHEDGEASPSPEVTLWERSLDLWTSAIAPRRGVATATARATAFGVTPKTGTLNTAGTSFVAPHAQALREVDQGLAFLTRIPRSISADASASVGL